MSLTTALLAALILTTADADTAEPMGCLPPPQLSDLDGLDEFDILSSQGIRASAVRDVMEDVFWEVQSCVPSTAHLDGSLEVSLSVSCTGEVTSAELLSRRDVPDDVARCALRTIAAARFPRHQLPEGFDFGYRVEIFAQ